MRVPFYLRLNSGCAYAPLKREDDAGLIPEIALVIVAMCEGVAETREYVINFCYANGDGVVNRDVGTPSNDKVKGVIARAFRDDAFRKILNQIPGNIRTGAAKHGFQKWLDMRCTKLKHRTYVIREQAGLDVTSTRRCRTYRRVAREIKVPCLTAVALELLL
jgi:hypothetical protein